MKIGILGSGDVGQQLGRGFVSIGDHVMIGTRSPKDAKLKPWLTENKIQGSVGSFAQSAQFGELLILAVSGKAVEEVINLAGKDNFQGKILIDVTNPLDFSGGQLPTLFIGTTDSLGEKIQRMLPHTRVVKCWNIVPNSQMISPGIHGDKPTMMICGNDGPSKEEITTLLKKFQWEDVIDIGNIEGARYLEALVALWVRVSNAVGTWNQAFKVLR